MADRKLYGKTSLITEFVTNHLEKLQTLDAGWATLYLEKKSNREWLKYISDDRSNTPDLIQVKPKLNTEDLINIALNSVYEDESQAAIRRLISEENTNQYRLILLDEIKKKITNSLNHLEKERIIAIIQQSDLLNKNNRKDIINKPYSEVQKDYEFYKKIALETSEILSALK